MRLRLAKMGSIISSSQYSIDWLRDAREPGNRREISNRSRYQRTKYWGDIERVKVNVVENEIQELSIEKLEMVNDYLGKQSEREQEAFLSVIGQGNSYIGKRLSIWG